MENKAKTIEEFVANEDNRLNAEEKCVSLWNILTKCEPVENSKTRIFTAKEVTDKTDLSHKKAQELFQLLKVFGLLEFTKGSHEFKLNFTPERYRKTIEAEVSALAGVLNDDIGRYIATVKTDDSLSEDKKEEIIKVFKESVVKTIENLK